MSEPVDLPQRLAQCDYFVLDRPMLSQLWETRLAGEVVGPLAQTHPHLFADVAVVASEKQLTQMFTAIAAIERVVALPAFRQRALNEAPDIARVDPGNPGVFFGYDFHWTAQGVRLIEVNTNAGGAMLNALLAQAQRPLEADAGAAMTLGPTPPAQWPEVIFAMFQNEWRGVRGDSQLKCIAIVDEAPREQYLYPEFVLFRRLFESHGVACVIADPRDLQYRAGALYCAEQRIDMVYNRHTDFAWAAPQLEALRRAYQDRAVVVSPHPFAHALYADKRNMMMWSDKDELRALGASEADSAALLATVPKTRLVTVDNADELWGARRGLFFKPFAGYGGRAAYRGDKITKRVWEEIRAGGYIAQDLAPPSERCVRVNGVDTTMKVDVRNYVYQGRVQWVSARIYQGQTTNFRTPGGGFAPVYSTSFIRS